jgi:hypothetical protein
MKEKRICKFCGKEFIPCHKTSVFCSKSCATSFRNREKVKDGTHNFIGMDHGAAAREKVKNGTHPFLKGNMSEESILKQREGIKRARLRESQEHRHPWQNPKNFIENEYSRSNSIMRDYTGKIYLYIADCPDFEDAFKIGWTRDLEIREKDSRTLEINHLMSLKIDFPEIILKIERDIKIKFFNQEFYNKYHSTEIFPNSLKSEILNFISLF